MNHLNRSFSIDATRPMNKAKSSSEKKSRQSSSHSDIKFVEDDAFECRDYNTFTLSREAMLYEERLWNY